MLGNINPPQTDDTGVSAKEIASGLLTELRAELGLSETDQDNVSDPNSQGERLNEAFHNMQSSLAAQLRTQKNSESPSKALDHVLSLLDELSPEARTLASVMASNVYHLTFDQFQALLRDSPLSESVSELRDKGLLVPLTGRSKKVGKPIPVYYFPSGVSNIIRAAFLLLPDMPDDVLQTVVSELHKVGYNFRT